MGPFTTDQIASLVKFAVVAFIVLVLGISAMNSGDDAPVETVQQAAEKQIFIGTRDLIPSSATNIIDVGDKWYTFDLMGKTFLIRAWGHGMGVTCIKGC